MPHRGDARSGREDLARALEDIAKAARQRKAALVQPYVAEVLEHRGLVTKDAQDRLALTAAGEKYLREHPPAARRPVRGG